MWWGSRTWWHCHSQHFRPRQKSYSCNHLRWGSSLHHRSVLFMVFTILIKVLFWNFCLSLTHAVLVALICVCLCRRKPVAAPHLPIGGENEDEWEQVPFERVQSNRGKQSKHDYEIGSAPSTKICLQFMQKSYSGFSEGTWMLREGTEQQLPRRKTYFLWTLCSHETLFTKTLKFQISLNTLK